jgi:hypothetical protein
MDYRDDVKSRVGHIPPPQPLLPPSEGKNFFKVELLVGKNRQVIRPFFQHHITDAPLSIDHYVARLQCASSSLGPEKKVLCMERVYTSTQATARKLNFTHGGLIAPALTRMSILQRRITTFG